MARRALKFRSCSKPKAAARRKTVADWGYMEFLDAITDPKHGRHEEFTEWQDVGFDSAAPPRLETFRYPIREPANGKLRSKVAVMSQSGPFSR